MQSLVRPVRHDAERLCDGPNCIDRGVAFGGRFRGKVPLPMIELRKASREKARLDWKGFPFLCPSVFNFHGVQLFNHQDMAGSA